MTDTGAELEIVEQEPNPFADIVLTDEELLDEGERRIFSDGRRKAIDYGDFRPETFRRAVVAVDLEYRRLGRVPAIREVYDSWPQIPVETYSKLYAHKGFREALVSQGIRVNTGAGLTQEQASALLLICDPTDRRTTATKMKSLGLTYAVYQAWMRDPVFRAERQRRSKENLDDVVPAALDRLAGNVEAGDQRAIEYVLAAKGVYSPAQANQQDAMRVVYAVLEAVQKHVRDKDVLQAILDDVRIAGKSFDLLNGPTL